MNRLPDWGIERPMTEIGKSRAITLPYNVQKLFEHALDWIHRYMGDPTGSDLRMGGGSVLAARWRHRVSTDVDLFVGLWTFANMEREIVREDPETLIRMGRLGQFIPSWIEGSVLRWTSEEGRIEIVRSERVTRERDTERIEGSVVQAEASAEILARKLLGRGERVLMRDVYDLAVGIELDEQAVDVAMDACIRWNPGKMTAMMDMLREVGRGWAVHENGPGVIDPKYPGMVIRGPEVVRKKLAERIQVRRRQRPVGGGLDR